MRQSQESNCEPSSDTVPLMAKRIHADGTATYERQHGQGSVYEDKFNGTWVAAVTTRLPDGRRKRKTARARTKTEANTKLRDLLKDQLTVSNRQPNTPFKRP